MSKTIYVNGVRVSYSRDCVTNNPQGILLFLHGWAGSSQSWEHNIWELSKTFECLAVDLPGFGVSGTPQQVWGMIEYAQFVRDFAGVLNLRRFALVGKSFGGRVAILYASKWPETLSHLILVAAAGLEVKSFSTLIKIALAKAGKGVSSLLGAGAVEFLRSLYYKAARITKDSSSYKWEVRKLVTSLNLAEEAERIAVPTLIIWGRTDSVLPLKVGKELSKRIKNSTLQLIQGGHNAHQESAKEFNALVEEYLTSN